MAKKKMPDSFKRYRFSVPNADTSVNNWIDAQSNLSYSIRELIKTAIRCNGYTDVSCYPVRQILMEMPVPVQPGSGYPIEYAMMQQANGSMPGFAPGQPVQQPQSQPLVQPPLQAPQPAAMPTVTPAAPAAPVPAPAAEQVFADPADILG